MSRSSQVLHVVQSWGRRTILVALVSGAIAATSGASPTGFATFDRLLTGAVVALVTWVAATAHWKVLAACSLATVAIAWHPLVAAAALVALGASVWLRTRVRETGVFHAATAGLILNTLLYARLHVVTGLSALVGFAIAFALVSSGLRRRPSHHKRLILSLAGVSFALAVASSGALGASAFGARTDLSDAVDHLRDGVDLLSEGDTDAASEALRSAASELRNVSQAVEAPWTQPSRLVPVVAQHRRALVELASGASNLVDSIVGELDGLDLSQIKPKDGKIDLSTIDSVRTSTEHMLASVETLQATIKRNRSTWLIGPAANEIQKVSEEIDKQVTNARNARDTLELAPAMLGADGPRHYFFAFTTPAEARGSGGFMGNWAEVTIDDGDIELTRTGRTRELNNDRDPYRKITGPEDFLAHFARYGYAQTDYGYAPPDIWSVVNPSPHFPSIGQVMAELYPQSGGQEVDGVISMDVYALASFLQFTGPIRIEGFDKELNSDNIVEFLLYDQYRTDYTDSELNRTDVLAAVTDEVVNRLLDGALPDPLDLVDALSPLVAEGRLMAYATRPEEQAMFERLNIAGALKYPETGDGFAVAFNNLSRNKLELWLDTTLDYQLTAKNDSTAEAVATVTLTNSAPTTGWPAGVIGNYIKLPTGTSRLQVMLYSKLPFESATLDGEPLEAEYSVEAQYFVADVTVDVASGTTATLVAKFSGAFDAGSNDGRIPVVFRSPPMVRPMETTITYTSASGRVMHAVIDKPGTFQRLRPLKNLPDE